MIENIKFLSPVLLDKSHDKSDFDCGQNELNIFLKEYAMLNSKNNSSRTYVSICKDTGKIAGYYTLTFGSISHEEAILKVKKHRPRPRLPISVMILARLAVNKTHQKWGLGEAMLRDALLRSLQASEIAGLKAIIAHAKNESASNFYKKYDFEESSINSNHLMVTLKDLTKLI